MEQYLGTWLPPKTEQPPAGRALPLTGGRVPSSLSRKCHYLCWCLPLLVLLLSATDVAGAVPSRLCRITIRPHATFTRLLFQMDSPTQYALHPVAHKRIRLTFSNTDGPRLKRLRGYADRHIGGVVLSQRGDDLLVTISARDDGSGVRSVEFADGQLLALDIGPTFKRNGSPSVIPGREQIWRGAEKLIREFDPPLKSEIPFVPTDRRMLQKLIPEEDIRLILAGEAALYKGEAAAAEEVFTVYMKKESPVRALAAYRLGEAQYLLQKYGPALTSFREGERLWPQYMAANPAVTFYYADSIVRSGDLPGGRRILTHLIAQLSDKKYAPLLLVRLADILARQGRDMEALAIYRTVAAHFAGNEASSSAAMKLADRRLFATGGETYEGLVQEYMRLHENATGFSLREEAFFKAALLESMYGPAKRALSLVAQYEKKYPRGVFVNIARAMREDLLVPVYRELYAARDYQGLVSLAQENRDYLSTCLGDEKFITSLAESFAATGMTRGEITLFGNLLEREWAVTAAPFMLSRILDDAVMLADYTLAEGAARGFLQRFPRHPAAHHIREQLGGICYRKNNMAEVVAELSWLLEPKAVADIPESYYYLGKALENAGQHKGADKAMTLFIASAKVREAKSPLLSDAYCVSAFARTAVGDRKGALAVYRAGLEFVEAERRDQFLYKMGELHLQEGRSSEALGMWEKVRLEGSDPVWKKLAVQAIDDLRWREEVKRKITTLSKK